MAKDIIHTPVKEAIKKAGWTVTSDQYTMQFAEFTMYADLAAERVIAARRGKDKIAIEIKSFVKRSSPRCTGCPRAVCHVPSLSD